MKVRPSVKPMCEKCKIIRAKAASWSFARIPSISRDRANKIGGALKVWHVLPVLTCRRISESRSA